MHNQTFMSKWDHCIFKESFTITAIGNFIARKLNHRYYHTSFVSMYQTIILSNKPLYSETQCNRLLIYCVLASRHGPCLEQYCPNYQTCNGCGAGPSNLAMVAGLAYSNSWPIKPCNGFRAGLFKQGNGCTAGLFRQLAYQTLQWLQGWSSKPCNGCWASLFKRLVYQTLQWLLGRPIQTRQWLLGWSIKPCRGCRAGLFKQGNGCMAGLFKWLAYQT